MKKYLSFIFVMLLVTAVVYADDSKFNDAFFNCSPYSEFGTVDVEGVKADSHKQILGWEDNKCVYKENIKFGGVNSCVTCRFTKSQVSELVSVMRAYNLLQQYSNEQVDTSSVSAVQNNPVVKAWNKYLQDNSVCKMQVDN